VAQFASFVQATGYITDAERQKQAAVFLPDANHPQQWWQLKSGYTWQSQMDHKQKKHYPTNLSVLSRKMMPNIMLSG
jgi:hypothetical protein